MRLLVSGLLQWALSCVVGSHGDTAERIDQGSNRGSHEAMKHSKEAAVVH